MLKLHSTVGIITNSSTTIYTVATKETIKAAIRLLEALGGNKDEFGFTLSPGDEIVERVIEDAEEYLGANQVRKMDKFDDWREREAYVRELITDGKVCQALPEDNSEGYLLPWLLIVTRNGEPFTEFKDFFESFSQEASYG